MTAWQFTFSDPVSNYARTSFVAWMSGLCFFVFLIKNQSPVPHLAVRSFPPNSLSRIFLYIRYL